MAHSTLNRGERLRDADITMERADVLMQRDAFLNFPTSDESLELSENIPTGRPIFNRFCPSAALVLRGQLVEGVFQEAFGHFPPWWKHSRMAGSADVRVRNPKTRRELHRKGGK